MKPEFDIRVYNEDKLRKDFEKAMNVGHIYGHPIKKGKRFRSAFTTEQVNYLEKEFRKYPYIGNARRKDVALVLDIPERAVKIWFQNRRMREKKDLSNKESDSDKSVDVSESQNTKQSKSDSSLPLLTQQSNHEENQVNTSSEPTHTYKDYSKDPTSKEDSFSPPKIEISVIQSNAASTTTSESPSSSSKCETEDRYEVFKKALPNDPYDNQYQFKHTPNSSYVQYARDHHSLSSSYPICVSSPSAVPQDLSSKPVTQNQNTLLEQNSSALKYNPEAPFYLKDFYTAPYVPPGSMIWRPLSMTPIMTAAPSIAIPSPGSTSQDPSVMKRNCNCDCHKPQIAPMIVSSNPHTNMQYVITAVPFQNTSPKF
ncbi:homeobox domain-containing protein [Phthorimaea operculella]|nr:homeobox domain-containing protein [Phthorimaea operculella]